MPLSKAKNRERMKELRLHAKKRHEVVQPKPSVTPNMYLTIPQYVDADGNPVYDVV